MLRSVWRLGKCLMSWYIWKIFLLTCVIDCGSNVSSDIRKFVLAASHVIHEPHLRKCLFALVMLGCFFGIDKCCCSSNESGTRLRHRSLSLLHQQDNVHSQTSKKVIFASMSHFMVVGSDIAKCSSFDQSRCVNHIIYPCVLIHHRFLSVDWLQGWYFLFSILMDGNQCSLIFPRRNLLLVICLLFNNCLFSPIESSHVPTKEWIVVRKDQSASFPISTH